MNDEWITLDADNFQIGTEVQVTGGRIWSVAEMIDRKRDSHSIALDEDMPHVFISGGEIRDSIRSRHNDVEIWTW